MKKLILGITIAAVAVFTFSSCKKKDNNDNIKIPDTRASQLVGTWTQIFTGIDDDGNGTWDSSEKITINTASAKKIVIRANGTSSFTIDPLGVGEGTWSLYNNDNYIKLVSTFRDINITDTTKYRIFGLNTKDLIVRDSVSSPFIFEQYAKQQ